MPKVVQQNGGKHYSIMLLAVYMNSYLLILGYVTTDFQNRLNSLRNQLVKAAHVIHRQVSQMHQIANFKSLTVSKKTGRETV